MRNAETGDKKISWAVFALVQVPCDKMLRCEIPYEKILCKLVAWPNVAQASTCQYVARRVVVLACRHALADAARIASHLVSDPLAIPTASATRSALVRLVVNPFATPATWADAPRPPKVALQIGHEDVANHPPELRGLRWNTGGYADGVQEIDVNRQVVGRLERRLLALGIEVDILPATPPVGYRADLFISVHADSVRDPNRRGYKSAHFDPPRNALEPILREHLDEAYLRASRLADDSINVSPTMREFYAFNHRKYRHSVHPDTPAVIVEMGYISNLKDRAYLAKASEPADALLQGIVSYLREQGKLPEPPDRTPIELPELRAEVMRLK